MWERSGLGDSGGIRRSLEKAFGTAARLTWQMQICHSISRGYKGAEFRSFLFRSLEGQGAPQNSFISIKLIVSIPTAPTNLLMFPRVSRLIFPESTNRYYLGGEVLI